MPHYVMLDEEGMYLHYSIGDEKNKQCYFSPETLPKAFAGATEAQKKRLGERPFGAEFTIPNDCSTLCKIKDTANLAFFALKSLVAAK